jgi:hypothetical protein
MRYGLLGASMYEEMLGLTCRTTVVLHMRSTMSREIDSNEEGMLGGRSALNSFTTPSTDLVLIP